MLVLFIAGIILMMAGFYNLFLVFLTRNPANLSTAAGTLVKASGYKNVRGTHGNWVVKDQTEYSYSYAINGRIYQHKGRINQHKRVLPKKVTIVYITRFPRHSGIENFTAQVERLLGFFLLFQGAVLIAMCYCIQTA